MKSHNLLSLILLGLMLLFVKAVFAVPVISSASGTFTHSNTITISGFGFGTKSQVAPVLWDTVGNQFDYSGLSNGATIPTGGSNPWSYNGCNAVKYATSSLRHSYLHAMYSSRPTLEIMVF